ncbi:hypothetical protein ACIBO9_49020 [Streptomyces prunicolor]|uniref:hypothetical protein n=1 Tax=Streptomyces TaxID=1883 RepID=UPI0037D68AF5
MLMVFRRFRATLVSVSARLLAATATPAAPADILGGQALDPRTGAADTTLCPWFVGSGADAGARVDDGDTQWYDTHHYLTVGADACDVTPALRSSAPSLAEARTRVAELAADGASYVSTDWITAPADGVLDEVPTRG